MLTVRQLVAEPSLRLNVVGGTAGLDRPVRAAHVSELLEPGPWLHGGDVLMTLGLLQPTDLAGARRYARHCLEHGVAAVIVGLGPAMPFQVAPAPLAEAGDLEGLPVIEVPDGVPFIAITEWILNWLAAQERRLLRQVAGAGRNLTGASVTPTPLPDLLHSWYAATGTSAVVLDLSGTVLAEAGPGAAGLATLGPRIAQDLTDDHRPGIGDLPIPDLGDRAGEGPDSRSDPWPDSRSDGESDSRSDGDATGDTDGGADQQPKDRWDDGPGHRPDTDLRPVGPRPDPEAASVALPHLLGTRQPHGVLLIEHLPGGTGSADDQRRALLLPVLTALLSLHLEHQFAADRPARIQRAHVVAQLVRPGLGEEQAGRLAARVGLPAAAARVVVVRPHPGEDLDALAVRLTAALPGAVARPWSAGIELIVPDTAADVPVVEVLARTVGERPTGVGALIALHELASSARQAHALIEVSRQTGRPAQLGHSRASALLLQLSEPNVLAAVSSAVLAPLDSLPEAERLDLLDTLQTWLSTNGVWESAAGRLGIHRNTVRNRIAKIAALTGRSLDDGDERYELWLALRARAAVLQQRG